MNDKILEGDEPYFDKMAKNILGRLSTFEQKQAYARSLRRSLTLTSTEIENINPVTAIEIQGLFGFDPPLQRSYFISLNRQQAKVFLKSHGYPINKKFDQNYNIPNYKEKFNRDPYKYATRQMILTVAEWLVFIDYNFPPEIPEILNQYL